MTQDIASNTLTREQVVAMIDRMFGDTANTQAAYLPIVDLAFGMAGSGPHEWSNPAGTQRAEILGNLRFAANEINMLADALEASA